MQEVDRPGVVAIEPRGEGEWAVTACADPAFFFLVAITITIASNSSSFCSAQLGARRPDVPHPMTYPTRPLRTIKCKALAYRDGEGIDEPLPRVTRYGRKGPRLRIFGPSERTKDVWREEIELDTLLAEDEDPVMNETDYEDWSFLLSFRFKIPLVSITK